MFFTFFQSILKKKYIIKLNIFEREQKYKVLQ